MRKVIMKVEAPPKKKKADAPPPPKVTHGWVWVSARFVGWQEAVLVALQVGPTGSKVQGGPGGAGDGRTRQRRACG